MRTNCRTCGPRRALGVSAKGGPRNRDLMIRGPRAMETEPRRVVVELAPDEYRVLEVACRGRSITAPELVRVVALRLARDL